MKRIRMSLFTTGLLFIFVVSGSHAFGQAENQRFEEIYKKYGEIRKTIFDGTFDDKRNGPNVFLKSVEILAGSDEEKALAAILFAELASIAELEACVSIELRPDESHQEFIRRQDTIRSTVIGEARNRLEETFSKVNIPDHSYLMILYHWRMVNLAIADSTVDHQKLPPNAFSHCDALMNSAVIKKNKDAIEPPIKLDDIWERSGIKGKRWQQYLVRTVRSYLCYYRIGEYFVEKKRHGLFTDLQDVDKTIEEEKNIREDVKKINDMKNQLLLAKYPLSDYPFLEDLLVDMDD